MNLTLSVDYRTRWGETVGAQLTFTTRTGRETRATLPLSTSDGQLWTARTAVPASAVRATYTYYIMRDGQTRREEWAVSPHRVSLAGHDTSTRDRWRDLPADAYRYTSAFTECFARHTHTEPPAPRAGLTLTVTASEVPAGEKLVVLGNQAELGSWKIKDARPLHEHTPNQWSITLDPDALTPPVEYKFFTTCSATGELRAWETRDNRRLPPLSIAEGTELVLEDEPVRLPYAPYRTAGTVIPVFSLRSEGSFGVGDFGDLRRMIDWLVATGQHCLQVLPINDTTISHTHQDSYPYNAISIYALHPLYADLRALPPLEDPALRTTYRAMGERLNALPQLDYEGVIEAKMGYLGHLYEQEGRHVLATREYKAFAREAEHWLTPYTQFCARRDGAEGAEAFYAYVQYLLHTQLTAVRDYARLHGVCLKGDIPIGISRESVEAQVEPEYFNLDSQAGAPPDAFSAKGQNWGFPTYNWARMEEDGYAWWRRRFATMAGYFDAYRIDHVLGFFRIWEIPLDSVHGLLGQFAPAMPMSVEEVESFGLTWHDNYLEPYISDWVVDRVFGPEAERVKATYLDADGYGQYRMKAAYDTQRKVSATDIDGDTKEGLYALISNVLFVRDRRDPTHFHPRIAAQTDAFYKTLSEADRDAFNRLYNHYYYERHNQFWYGEAMKKLPPIIEATRMLVCAEDLGMVPDCVPWVMNELRILTLEIQSMPKRADRMFGNLSENPYTSVATQATHDMAPLRQWWDEDWPRTQHFFNDVLRRSGPAPHPMPADLCEEVVAQHLASPSMLCLLSLQDWLSIDDRLRLPDPDGERINIPADPHHYWRYRMHLTIEQLMGAEEYNEKVRKLIAENRPA